MIRYNDTSQKDNIKELLTPKNETPTSAELYFYGDIVSNWYGAWDDSDQYPEAIRDFLKEHDEKNLNIYINSGGGSVFAGLAIYNMLKRHKGYKTVYVDGIAASIASVIAFAGDRVIVPSNAFIMIHKPWVYCEGNSEDFRKAADDLDALETGIINVYQEHIADGVEIDDIKNMVAAETWLNGQEAAKYFNIEIGEAKEYAAKLTYQYSNTPKEVIKSAQADCDKTACKTAEKITRIAINAITKGV